MRTTPARHRFVALEGPEVARFLVAVQRQGAVLPSEFLQLLNNGALMNDQTCA